MNLACPPSMAAHVQKVLQGEYEVAYQHPHPVKIDAEGSEIDILSRLPGIDVDVVLLEYHSEENRRKVDLLLPDYLLIGGHVRCLHRGVVKYAHRRVLG